MKKEAKTSLHIIFEGVRLAASAGETVAAALLAHGAVALSESRAGAPRGYYCGIGVCHDCVVSIDGRHGQRACITQVRDGMRVARQRPYPVPATLAADLAEVRSTDPVPRVVDVLVVGAGPSGLAAALAAATDGAAVLVVDERIVPPGPAGVSIEGETLVWGGARRGDGGLEIMTYAAGSVGVLHPRRLIIATGAYERPVIVPGWTLPGVMTTGAAQILLRSNGLLPGQRVVIAGNGPLNLQLAADLLPLAEHITLVQAAPPDADPRLAGVTIHWQHRLIAIEGEGRASRAIIAPVDEAGVIDRGRARVIDADAVVTGDGFWPASELARLLGCEASQTQPDIVIVGKADGSGEADMGLSLAKTETIICRCECVTLGTLQGTVERHDVRDPGSLKRLTRAGMGRCQGRYCAPLLAQLLGEPVGRALRRRCRCDRCRWLHSLARSPNGAVTAARCCPGNPRARRARPCH